MNTRFKGFNRAWSIQKPSPWIDGPEYQSATGYEYGMFPPRYSMPATIGEVWIRPRFVDVLNVDPACNPTLAASWFRDIH